MNIPQSYNFATSNKEKGQFPQTCSTCKQTFPYPAALWIHKLTHFPRKRETCPLCKKCVYSLKQHSLIHKQRRIHQCLYCNKQYLNAYNLNKHLKGEKVKKKCLKCNARVINLHGHLQIHDKKCKQMCPVCKRLVTNRTIKAHLERHKNSWRIKSVRCHVCHAHFSTNFRLSCHMKKHGDNYKTPCPICKVPIVTKVMKSHVKIHKERKVETCHICQKSYLHLKLHLRIMHSKRQRRKRCPFCHNLVIDLRGHIKVHAIIRQKFQCHHCKKTYLTQGGLEEHEKCHKMETRKSCPVCKIFFARGYIAKHLLTHHPDRQTQRESCKECGKSTLKKCMKAHLRLHTNRPILTCNICTKTLYTTGALKKHLLIHRGMHQATCPICKVKVGKSVLPIHLLQHSGKKKEVCQICNKEYLDVKQHMMAMHR